MSERDEIDAAMARARMFSEMVDPRPDVDPASIAERFPELSDVVVADHQIEGPHGTVLARSYLSPNPSGSGLVWVHGGGFLRGNLDMPESHWVSLELASRGVDVLALDYQKALGEVHHPTLSDEVLAGWLAASSGGFLPTVTPGRLHLGGASAGGNLSAAVAIRLGDSADTSPASLILVYPALHAVLPELTPSAALAAAELPEHERFPPDMIRVINLNYTRSISGLSDPSAFPADGNVTRLPPTLIVNAEADDLRCSGEAFGSKLNSVGIHVVVDFEPGTRHGYLDVPGLTEAVRTIDHIAGWIAQTDNHPRSFR
ncbi:alpha/beta hydrolase [Subtercola frigoramans]|uniref:Acetyl esterase/lipase n=1 Tax=Subtercola frigoramans TaxID=120298 RepID=A0ABS2L163_9MICO|nr:alpha/beta hydrolase fold domain-containing protein [Subtercola frigoramans]MBM7470764.1 acetyl esterase/lipase [Subtercola frigoramans]